MTASTIKREENGNIVLHITIPEEAVKKTQETVLEDLAKNLTVQGFRKGKAPKHVVKKNIEPDKLQEETLRKLIPEAYIASIKDHNLNPIVNPKIHVDKLTEDSDWTFTATTCELPKIDLGKYKEKVKEVTAKSKIIIPGKQRQEPSFDDLVEAIVGSIKTTIPGMLVEQEVDRLLSQTLDEVKKLGLTLDQYLTSTGKTPEQLRKEYSDKAIRDITIEFALQQIAQDEKITVEEKEIEEAIGKAKDTTEKSYLENNKYMLASILRQQKTLDFLKNL